MNDEQASELTNEILDVLQQEVGDNVEYITIIKNDYNFFAVGNVDNMTCAALCFTLYTEALGLTREQGVKLFEHVKKLAMQNKSELNSKLSEFEA